MKRIVMPLLLLAALGIALLPSASVASSESPSDSPDLPVGAMVGAAPQVESHIDGTVYVASDSSIAVSHDQGMTWRAEIYESGQANTPRIASPVPGEVYLVWERYHASIPCSRELMFSKSDNYLVSLASPVLLSDPGRTECNIFPSLSVTTDGVVLVGWIEEDSAGARAPVIRRSFDGGVTWSPIKELFSGPPTSDHIGVAVAPGGDTTIAYQRHGTAGTGGGLYVAHWQSVDPDPQAPSRISTDSGGPVDVTLLPGGGVAIVYGFGDIRLAYSIASAPAWTADIEVSGSPSGTLFVYGRIAALDDAIAVTYCDVPTGRLFFVRSSDLGQTWSQRLEVADLGGPVHCDNGLADSLDAGGSGLAATVFRRDADGRIFVSFVTSSLEEPAGLIPTWLLIAKVNNSARLQPGAPDYVPGTWARAWVGIYIICTPWDAPIDIDHADHHVSFRDGIYLYSTRSDDRCIDEDGDVAEPIVGYGPIMVDTKAPTCRVSPTTLFVKRKLTGTVSFALTYSDATSGIASVVPANTASGGAVVNSTGGPDGTTFNVTMPNSTGGRVEATWTITDVAGNVFVCKGTIRAK